MSSAWKRHWPEYLMEGAELGLFMISACLFVVLLEHPSSPVRQAIPSGILRRVLMGLAMGVTAIGIIFSPLGKRSGGHFNPAVTLREEDFGELRHHGGVSPAWPISYDEMEPYYARAEELYHVHGEPARIPPTRRPRGRIPTLRSPTSRASSGSPTTLSAWAAVPSTSRSA